MEERDNSLFLCDRYTGVSLSRCLTNMELQQPGNEGERTTGKRERMTEADGKNVRNIGREIVSE